MRGGGQFSRLSLICYNVGIFLLGLGIENLSVSQVILYVALLVETWVHYKRRTGWAAFSFICSLLSAAACIFNPAGNRLQYEASANANASNLEILVKQNINSALQMLLKENVWLFLILASVLLFIFFQKHRRRKGNIWIRVCYINIMVGALILLVTAVPLRWLLVGTNGQVAIFQTVYHMQLTIQDVVFSDHVLSMMFWLCWIIQLALGGLFFCSKESIAIRTALISFAACSIGVVWILPYMPRRTLFFGLSVIIAYTAALTRQIELTVYSKKVWKIAVFLVCIVQLERYMFLLVPVKQVTVAREKIFEEYHLRIALGETIDLIKIPAYPADSINFEDSQINPSPEVNEYPYNAMKDYYHLPQELQVVVETQD